MLYYFVARVCNQLYRCAEAVISRVGCLSPGTKKYLSIHFFFGGAHRVPLLIKCKLAAEKPTIL
jgi:hypothetical protein